MTISRRALVVGLLPAAGLLLGAGVSRGSSHPVVLGVYGDPARFAAQTGQASQTRMFFVGWGQGLSYGSPFADLFAMMGAKPMLALNANLPGGGAITPRQVATGSGDAYLVALNHAVHAWAKPIYVRPFPEMNGHWNPFCAYNQNGTRRDASHTTALVRAAFARVYEIVHGGPRVNKVLAALGQPLVRTPLDTNTNAEVIWNPQGAGNPYLPGNSAAAYYPGDSYVDVIGDDLYDIRFNSDWRDAEALYAAHPGKPFAFPEWAPWDIDDPGFVAHMASFVKTHSRVELISYYSGRPGSLFDLARKPKTLSAYRKLILPLGRSDGMRVGVAPLVVVLGCLTAGVAAAGTAGVATFKTPSGNIGCIYSSAEPGFKAALRCDIRSGSGRSRRGRSAATSTTVTRSRWRRQAVRLSSATATRRSTLARASSPTGRPGAATASRASRGRPACAART